jgi:hypothetical protein
VIGSPSPCNDFPHDLDAERATLGAVMVAPERFAEVVQIIDVADFYRDVHRDIFAAMRTIDARGDAIDFLTLKDELAKAGCLDDVGPAYVFGLTDGVPRSTNVAQYARIVQEKARARDGIKLCLKTIDALRSDSAAIGNGLPAYHRDAWDRIVANEPTAATGLAEDGLTDAVDVAREGQQLEIDGIPELMKGVIPDLGMLGFLVGFAKTGKSTFGQGTSAAIAMGRPFLDRDTKGTRVLNIMAEDPPEYAAWLARHLDVAPSRMTFYRRPILLDVKGLAQISTTVKTGNYGFVYIASWQAVIRGLVRDENDNAGVVRVVEDVKNAARATGVPWLIDAHSGKGEDQGDDADPSYAMRGASAAPGAADFTLSLRYADGAFGTKRRLSGKGRFVSFEPIVMDFDPKTSTYTAIGATKDVARETTWRLIVEQGAITTTPQTAADIAYKAGLQDSTGKPTSTHRRQVQQALNKRADVGRSEELRRGQKTTPPAMDVGTVEGSDFPLCHCATPPYRATVVAQWALRRGVGRRSLFHPFHSMPRMEDGAVTDSVVVLNQGLVASLPALDLLLDLERRGFDVRLATDGGVLVGPQ